MTKNQKIFAGIDTLVKTKELDRELIIEGLEEAISIAIKKTYDYEKIDVSINSESNRIVMNGYQTVVPDGEVIDEINQIEISNTKKGTQLGSEVKVKLKIEKSLLERAVVQSAKQVFRQKLKEAEYKKILEKYGDKIGTIVSGNVEEIKDPYIYFKLEDGTLATLGPKGRIENEFLNPEVPVDLVIEMIGNQSKKGPKIIVSRTSNKLIEKAMKDEIPELSSGELEIKGIAREAGARSKVAIELMDYDSDIDVIGSCVGPKGQRINNVKSKLNGENIDLIEFFDDPIIYISNALAPALILAVQVLDEERRMSRVIVPDDQFSLAIGIDGQNVRLASILTGWKIDIKSESQASEEGIEYAEDII